jgi:hypothetical protein
MNTTELLERYLNAVQFWLPTAQRNDIIAELSEDIRSQIEEKEGELGREVNEAELVAILKHRGDPMFVARSYGPQRYLIGPVLYPVYILILKAFALFWVVPWLLVWLGFVIFSPAHREHSPIQNLAGLWLGVQYMVFNTTLGFVIVERLVNTQAWACKDWDPRRLPPLRNSHQISRSNSLFTLSANIAVLAWWLCYMPRSPVAVVSGFQLTFVPIWQLIYWSIVALILAKTALWSVNVFRPFWTKPRLIVRLAINIATAVTFCVSFKTHVVVGISAPDMSAAKGAQVIDAINVVTSSLFWVVLVGCIAAVLFDVRRIIGLVSQPTALASGFAVIFLLSGLMLNQASAQTTTASPVTSLSLPSESEIRQILADRIDVQHKSVGMVVGIVLTETHMRSRETPPHKSAPAA